MFAGLTVALPTLSSQEGSNSARLEAGFDLNQLTVPVATGVAVTVVNEVARGAINYVRTGLQRGLRTVSGKKQPPRSRSSKQWTEEDKSTCVKEMVRIYQYLMFPSMQKLICSTRSSFSCQCH